MTKQPLLGTIDLTDGNQIFIWITVILTIALIVAIMYSLKNKGYYKGKSRHRRANRRTPVTVDLEEYEQDIQRG